MAAQRKQRQRTVAELTAAAKRRERTVVLCFAGDLQGQVEELQQQLADASDWTRGSLADTDPRTEIARQIEALREEMAANEAEFRFRALSARAYSDLLAAHPPREGVQETANAATLPGALVAASCVDPVMTAEEYAELAEVISHAQAEALFDAAWTVNTQQVSVPFSLASSAILASLTGAK